MDGVVLPTLYLLTMASPGYWVERRCLSSSEGCLAVLLKMQEYDVCNWIGYFLRTVLFSFSHSKQLC